MLTSQHPHAPGHPPLRLQKIMSITFDGAGTEFVVIGKSPELKIFPPPFCWWKVIV